MDMALGDDPYDSFKRYQTRVIREYNRMAGEFGFHTVSARLNTPGYCLEHSRGGGIIWPR